MVLRLSKNGLKLTIVIEYLPLVPPNYLCKMMDFQNFQPKFYISMSTWYRTFGERTKSQGLPTRRDDRDAKLKSRWWHGGGFKHVYSYPYFGR